MPATADNLIWIDLEMTGLDVNNDVIIEIATIITDTHLQVLTEGPVFAIHQPTAVLDKMDQWNIKHHGQSGLIDRVQASQIDEPTAEQETLAFLKQWVPAGKSPMCGNSVCQDRRFLSKHMPQLESYFHYRHLDVSTLKILAQRWAPKIADQLKKKTQHLALQDIHDSIDELRYYRKHFIQI